MTDLQELYELRHGIVGCSIRQMPSNKVRPAAIVHSYLIQLAVLADQTLYYIWLCILPRVRHRRVRGGNVRIKQPFDALAGLLPIERYDLLPTHSDGCGLW